MMKPKPTPYEQIEILRDTIDTCAPIAVREAASKRLNELVAKHGLPRLPRYSPCGKRRLDDSITLKPTA